MTKIYIGLFEGFLKWCPRVSFLKSSAKKSYLIVLSGCSFLSLTNFFSLQKSKFFVKKLSMPCFMNWFFCWTLSCHFFHCKKVFLNAIYNGKKSVGLRKYVFFLQGYIEKRNYFQLLMPVISFMNDESKNNIIRILTIKAESPHFFQIEKVLYAQAKVRGGSCSQDQN